MAKIGSNTASLAPDRPAESRLDGPVRPDAPLTPDLPITPVTAADIAVLRAHPEFVAARRKAARDILADHSANRLVNMVFNDRGRFMIGMLSQYLHHTRLAGEADAGLTVGRLQAVCVETGLCSPGRATAMLNVMRFAGYLAPVPGSRDRRRRVFVPTERLIALQRARWSRHFTALAHIRPEGEAALSRLGQAWFEAALLRALGGGFVAGFRATDHVPELAAHLDRTGGLLTLLQLVVTVDEAGGQSDTPVSISTLASRFGFARAQIRGVLDAAAADGFIERRSGPRGPVTVLPSLVAVLDRFFAATFLYTAYCIQRALSQQPSTD